MLPDASNQKNRCQSLFVLMPSVLTERKIQRVDYDFLFSLFADVCSIFLILYRKNTIHYVNKKLLIKS